MKAEIVDCGIGWMLNIQYDNLEECGIPFMSYINAEAARYIVNFDAAHKTDSKPCDLYRVIRCRDCRSWSEPARDKTVGRCKLLKRPTDALFWCQGGVEKDGQAKD